jgi:hypothetical protein
MKRLLCLPAVWLLASAVPRAGAQEWIPLNGPIHPVDYLAFSPGGRFTGAAGGGGQGFIDGG